MLMILPEKTAHELWRQNAHKTSATDELDSASFDLIAHLQIKPILFGRYVPMFYSRYRSALERIRLFFVAQHERDFRREIRIPSRINQGL